jgi:Tfp pilus assembly protein PilF
MAAEPKSQNAAEDGRLPALAAFEAGMRALQRHDYERARDEFRQLLAAFPSERVLVERVRVFLELCDRELRASPLPTSMEERVTLATAALNDGNDSLAEQLAAQVLDEVADHDLALYILAAVGSRRRDTTTALAYLRRAVHISPDITAQARHDADFAELRDAPEFRSIVDPSAASDDRCSAVEGRQASGRSDR